MIEVVAIKYNDIAPVIPISCKLPEEGGSIGRDEDNTLALPDPLRLLSRRHVVITPEGEHTYRVTNVSTANPAIINDVQIPPGESGQIGDGDILCIGGYLLEVHICEVSDPVLVTETTPPAAVPTQPTPGTTFMPTTQTAQTADTHAQATADINAILDQGGTRALISDDPLHLATLQPTVELADLADDGKQLLNGLTPENRAAPLASALTQDPLMEIANPLLQDGALDPLALFGGTEKTLEDWLGASNNLKPPPPALPGGTTPSRPISELHTPFSLNTPPVPPPAQPLIPEEFELDELLCAPDSPPDHPADTLPENPPENLNVPAMETPTTAPVGPIAAQAVTNSETDKPHPPVTDTQETPGNAMPASIAAQPPKAEPIPTNAPDPQYLAALHAALLQGLGLDALPAHPQLDADFMRLLGVLLRATIDGTLKLMAARATVKREVRANVTIISPERNNPLKFSPDADVALLYLFGQDHPGFMAAEDAVRQAFADLLSHQTGVISGMRAGLALVLERFDPQTLSRHAPPKNGMLDSLLPGGRKARLWDAYEHYFAQAQEQAQDRFQEFFGAAFVDAYEAQTTAAPLSTQEAGH